MPEPRASDVRRRRRGGLLLALGVLCGTIAVIGMPASSAQEPAATLFSYDLQTNANGYSTYYEDPSGARQGEGNVPEASTRLTTGPLGLALASLAWPGPVAANSGTLVRVLVPDAPEEAAETNYPVRAEARTGQDPPSSKNEIPGASMTASATTEAVEAEGRVENSAGDDGTFGPSRAHGKATLGATGTSDANSRVENVSVAEGVVKIDSVTSVAKALTDGTKASGDASTVISGMTIGGQPATIDEDGLTIGDEDEPLNAVANQIAKQALTEAGVEMVLGAPTKEIDGSSAIMSAPSLVITWESEGGTFGVVLGGARAAASGAPPLDDTLLGLDTDTTGEGAPAAPAPDGSTAGEGGDTVGSDDGATDGGAEPAEEPASAEAEAGNGGGGSQEVALDAPPIRSLSKPVRPAFFLLGLLAAVLIAIGMRQMADQVLAERAAASACPLEAEAT